MVRYIAFLRAINVGGHTVKMERLRELFTAFGLQNVTTFIASGNVIFDSPSADTAALERQIEEGLQAALGYPVTTFVRTSAELAAIAAYAPFPRAALDDAGNGLYISFLSAAPDTGAQARVQALRTPDDDFHIHQREFYWLRRGRLSDATITGGQLERAVGIPATMRNATTVRKLAARVS